MSGRAQVLASVSAVAGWETGSMTLLVLAAVAVAAEALRCASSGSVESADCRQRDEVEPNPSRKHAHLFSVRERGGLAHGVCLALLVFVRLSLACRGEGDGIRPQGPRGVS